MRLYLDNVSVSFGENNILKNVCFEVNTKDKVAIVGRNGCGKTTLLRVITGEQEIDTDVKSSSKIQKTGKFQIGYLKQIAFENDQETFENEILLHTIRSILKKDHLTYCIDFFSPKMCCEEF